MTSIAAGEFLWQPLQSKFLLKSLFILEGNSKPLNIHSVAETLGFVVVAFTGLLEFQVTWYTYASRDAVRLVMGITLGCQR